MNEQIPDQERGIYFNWEKLQNDVDLLQGVLSDQERAYLTVVSQDDSRFNWMSVNTFERATGNPIGGSWYKVKVSELDEEARNLTGRYYEYKFSTLEQRLKRRDETSKEYKELDTERVSSLDLNLLLRRFSELTTDK